ncbi:MAG: type II toxin-antitoxin system VapC family toxin [Thermoanaerobaculia bacterium]
MNLPRVFVDTGAWAAVQVVDDEHHAEAAETLQALLALPAAPVTTNHVIGETYTLLRVTAGYGAASRFLHLIAKTARLERVFVPEPLESRAFTLLAQFQDHDFSFVDATSFALMRTRRLRYAFAFDSHFATAGFLRVPLDAGVENVT